MIRTAARFGLDPLRAADLTVRELTLFCEGVAEAERAQMAGLLAAAWHGARLTAYAPAKGRDFPSLDKMLAPLTGPVRRRAAPDWRRDFEAMRRYAALVGKGQAE